MVNELLWVLLMVVTFLGILLAYRLFGRIGLYVWIAISIIIANIQVMKTIEIFGLVTAEGNIIYGTIFLAMDILGENYGKKAAYKGVLIGFFTLIAVTILMQLTLLFVPHESDTLSPALESIFSFLPRIALASITAYFLSQTLNIIIFHYIKKLTKGKMLWLRNNASTMISQFFDNIIFTYMAFVGLFGLFGWQQIFEWPIIFQIFITSLIMKYIVAVVDTPFIYWARKLKKEVPD
ncbi:queuosine precursor transporter [Candidatus Woesearchaeota archaeon]|nr:queuosine precursor transporter [Candidatus Woesearchaeota archaeon]